MKKSEIFNEDHMQLINSLGKYVFDKINNFDESKYIKAELCQLIATSILFNSIINIIPLENITPKNLNEVLEEFKKNVIDSVLERKLGAIN